jgi:hypothetical protein
MGGVCSEPVNAQEVLLVCARFTVSGPCPEFADRFPRTSRGRRGGRPLGDERSGNMPSTFAELRIKPTIYYAYNIV